MTLCIHEHELLRAAPWTVKRKSLHLMYVLKIRWFRTGYHSDIRKSMTLVLIIYIEAYVT